MMVPQITNPSQTRQTKNKGKKQSEYMTHQAIERTKATRFKKGHLPCALRIDGRLIVYLKRFKKYNACTRSRSGVEGGDLVGTKLSLGKENPHALTSHDTAR